MQTFTVVFIILVTSNLVISTCIPQNFGCGVSCGGGCGGFGGGCSGGCGGGCGGGCVGYGCGPIRKPYIREDLKISTSLAIKKIKALKHRIEKCKKACGGLELELALAKGSLLPKAELEIEAFL